MSSTLVTRGLGLANWRFDRTLAGSKKGMYFALTGIGDELLDKCTPRKEPRETAILLMRSNLFFNLNVNRLPARLKCLV